MSQKKKEDKDPNHNEFAINLPLILLLFLLGLLFWTHIIDKKQNEKLTYNQYKQILKSRVSEVKKVEFEQNSGLIKFSMNDDKIYEITLPIYFSSHLFCNKA